MTHELREHNPKHAFRVEGSRPVMSASSINCTRLSPDSGETETIESQELQTPIDSSQPSTFGVKEEEISLKPMAGTSTQNNPHLKRGDVLEIKFVSVSPETAEQGSHPAFHFMKLQRPNMLGFNKIKAASREALLVSAISKDSISTRTAWRLWVCLTEIDKVKVSIQNFQRQSEWIIPVKFHDGKKH
ncbi:UNVERIFIED_CONTAM: hypothetical protein Sindi_0817600 [Sesamum indicum]